MKKIKRKRLSPDAVYVSSEGIFEKKIKRKRLSSDAVYVSSEGIFEKKIKRKCRPEPEPDRRAGWAAERASARTHTAIIDIVEDGSV